VRPHGQGPWSLVADDLNADAGQELTPGTSTQMAREQTDAEIIRHLVEQVGFLRRSAAAYDAGDTDEAKRLATTARVLCHDGRSSRSLLGQLGLLNELRFIDTVPELDEPEAPARAPDNDVTITATLFSSPLAPIGGGPQGFAPQLDRAQRSRPKSFQDWWGTVVIEDPKNKLTRRDVVLALANQDAGAHVDPELTHAAYVAGLPRWIARNRHLSRRGWRRADRRVQPCARGHASGRVRDGRDPCADRRWEGSVEIPAGSHHARPSRGLSEEENVSRMCHRNRWTRPG
jgi:hypothetical protein